MMLKKRAGILSVVILLLISLSGVAGAQTASCENVVAAVCAGLPSGIDQPELVEALRDLNHTNNKRLPPKFGTKREARQRGWKPGKNLWSIDRLRGASIGGDPFRNMEGRLPEGKWREADLDYKGGRRGGKRLVFSRDGRRFVTVDHYNTFVEIPPCR
jgi:ribonuclease T1